MPVFDIDCIAPRVLNPIRNCLSYKMRSLIVCLDSWQPKQAVFSQTRKNDKNDDDWVHTKCQLCQDHGLEIQVLI